MGLEAFNKFEPLKGQLNSLSEALSKELLTRVQPRLTENNFLPYRRCSNWRKRLTYLSSKMER